MKIDRLSYDIGAVAARPVRLSGASRRAATLRHGRASTFRDSLTLGAKVALDKALWALRLAMIRTPTGEQWLRIVWEVAQARRLWKARGWLMHPNDYHVAPPALESPRIQAARVRGVPFQHLTFDSEYAPHVDEPGHDRWLGYAANRTAHAWVFQHFGRPRPWLVCIHGYGLGIPLLDFQAFAVSWLHRQLGLNLVLPVLPLHGPRKRAWQSGEGFFGGDMLDTIHAEAQTLWDLRRIISWVRTQDAPAVGVYGLSLGGYNTALLAAYDSTLACVIAGIPPSDFVGLAQLHSRMSVLRIAQQAGLNWDDVSAISKVISPLAVPPRVPHARRYIFGGAVDCIVPPDQVMALWEHWGRPRIAWYDGSHLSLPWEPSIQEFVHQSLHATLGVTPVDSPIERAVA